MATHSSILAWRILYSEEPGGLQSIGSYGVGHDRTTKQQQQTHWTGCFKLRHFIVYKFGLNNLLRSKKKKKKKKSHFPVVNLKLCTEGLLNKPLITIIGFPRWHSGKEHKRCEFDPWIRKIPWRRKGQSTPVFLPGEFHGQRILVGYSPWGHQEQTQLSD